MERVHGETLKAFLKRLDLLKKEGISCDSSVIFRTNVRAYYVYRHDLDEEVALEAAKQIAEVLAKLHGGDLIHGDLTTSNLLLRCKISLPVTLYSLQPFKVANVLVEEALLVKLKKVFIARTYQSHTCRSFRQHCPINKFGAALPVGRCDRLWSQLQESAY